jgi:hypothetical protein
MIRRAALALRHAGFEDVGVWAELLAPWLGGLAP